MSHNNIWRCFYHQLYHCHGDNCTTMFRLGTPSPELSRVPSPASSSRDSITHADRVPLLQDDARADWSLAAREGSEDDDPQTTKVGKWAITCLLLQHVSR